MNSKSTALRCSALALAIAPVLVVTACAATKPAVANAPSNAPVSNAATAPARAEPTSGTIAIADEIRTACGISTEDALFPFDSATLESTDIKPLDAIARCFTTGPLAGRAMRLVGHADPRGPSEYNMVLGQRRADRVDGYIGRKGVRGSQMVTTTRGAIDATGQDEAGWAHDRRVDVQLGA